MTLPERSLEAAPPLRSLGTEVGGSPAVIFGVQLTQSQRDLPTDPAKSTTAPACFAGLQGHRGAALPKSLRAEKSS